MAGLKGNIIGTKDQNPNKLSEQKSRKEEEEEDACKDWLLSQVRNSRY